jgi:hypothetical protein
MMKTSSGLHEKYPLFLPDLNKILISRRFFKKFSNIKFPENPSSGSRVIPCGRTDRHDEAYVVAFRNFSNAATNKESCGGHVCATTYKF